LFGPLELLILALFYIPFGFGFYYWGAYIAGSKNRPRSSGWIAVFLAWFGIAILYLQSDQRIPPEQRLPAASSKEPETEFLLVSTDRRFGAYLLEGVLITITLGIGWLLWLYLVAPRGQTPAKQLLGIRIISHETGYIASAGKVWLREIVAKDFVIPIALSTVLYIVGGNGASLLSNLYFVVGGLMIVTRTDKRALWDLISETELGYFPNEMYLDDLDNLHNEHADAHSLALSPATATHSGGIVCSRCGNANSASARFCSYCANALGANCMYCGNELERGARFCPYCGRPLEEREFITPR
jgi:uncharacterized RDD family membrane protein YckC